MSDYKLKLKLIRDDFNTIRTEIHVFDLNQKAYQLVEDLVDLFEENLEVMQQLVTDIQNIQPDSTYYTKTAIDERITSLNEAKEHLQLELLKQTKKNTQIDSFMEKIVSKVEDLKNEWRLIYVDLKAVKERIDRLEELDRDGKILTSQATETLAEFIRNDKNSGIMTVKQGNYFSGNPVDQPIDTRYSKNDAHEHFDYKGMAGMGEYSYVANGYMGRTRHGDFRFFTKGGNFMEIIKNEAPSVPNYHFGVDNMQDLFRRYLDKELLEDEKELFGWDFVYLESYWLKINSLTDVLKDTFPSFRHQWGYLTASTLAYNNFEMSAQAKKARFENVPFLPIASKMLNKNGETTYSVYMYRILTHRVTDYNGKLAKEILEQKDELINRARFGDVGYYDRTATFELKENNIDKIVNEIPGLGGLSEIIENFETVDGYSVVSPANKARYHRRYKVQTDAVGRATYAAGWNDPTLIVSHTKNEEIIEGTSYMIPLEMILRTPLETWNPNDLEVKQQVTGKGTLENPYTGINANRYFYHTPSEFFETYGAEDPADTGTGVKAVLNKKGEVTKNVGSGIYITLPKIKSIKENMRIRFPISENAGKFSPSNIALSAYMQENDEMMAYLKLNTMNRS